MTCAIVKDASCLIDLRKGSLPGVNALRLARHTSFRVSAPETAARRRAVGLAAFNGCSSARRSGAVG